jgi:hypothetical protein
MRPRFLDSPWTHTRAPRTLDRHSVGWRELHEDDGLRAARGIIVGIIASLAIWVALLGLFLFAGRWFG